MKTIEESNRSGGFDPMVAYRRLLGKPEPASSGIDPFYQRRSEGMLGSAESAGYRQENAGNMLAGLGARIYGQAQGRTGPLWGALSSAAMRSPDFAVDRAANDAGIAYGKNAGMLGRQLSRMGINPNSGRFAGLMQENNLARAAGTAGAMTRARNLAEQSRFGNMLSAFNAGRAGESEGLGLLSRLGSGINPGLYRELSGDYGRLAEEQAMGAGMLGPQDEAPAPRRTGLRWDLGEGPDEGAPATYFGEKQGKPFSYSLGV